MEPNCLHEVSQLNLDLAIAAVYGNNSGSIDIHVTNCSVVQRNHEMRTPLKSRHCLGSQLPADKIVHIATLEMRIPH